MDFDMYFAKLGGLRPLGSDEFAGVPEIELLSIENILKGKLPDDYRLFLKKYGSCVFKSHTIGFNLTSPDAVYQHDKKTGIQNFKSDGSCVTHFYGSQAPQTNIEFLEEAIQVHISRMPSGFCPIANDGMGNKICIFLATEEVYFWEHEIEWDEEDYLEETGQVMPEEAKYQNVYHIANSFEAFLSKLYIVD